MASIMETPARTWRVQVERCGRREYRTFKTKTLAEKWGIQREGQLERGEIISADQARRTPFSAVIQEYRRRELPKKRNRAYPYILNALEQTFGRTRLAFISSADIAEYRDDRLFEVAPATVVKELNLLRSLLDYAVRDMAIHIPTNPARLISNPVVRNQRSRVFVEGEEAFLLRHLGHADLADAVRLAIETALRLGEILQLTPRDIDLVQHLAHIKHDPTDDRHTKTSESRHVPLSPAAIAIVSSRMSEGAERIFENWKNSDSFEKCWARGLKRARESASPEQVDQGYLCDLHFHDLRHVATSRLAQVFHILDLAQITGHKSLRSLQRYYHPDMAKLAKRLRQPEVVHSSGPCAV